MLCFLETILPTSYTLQQTHTHTPCTTLNAFSTPATKKDVHSLQCNSDAKRWGKKNTKLLHTSTKATPPCFHLASALLPPVSRRFRWAPRALGARRAVGDLRREAQVVALPIDARSEQAGLTDFASGLLRA